MLSWIKKNKTAFFFTIIIFTNLACWLLLKPVWPFSDDICYVGRAQEFLSPGFQLTQNEFQNRFGVYVPASFLFRFFGANPYTISFWPLVAGIFTSCIVFETVRKVQNPLIALLAALLISLNTTQITYSIALFPDLIVAFFATAAVLLTYHARTRVPEKKRVPFLIVLFIFLGLLTKITIILVFPFFAVLFLVDWRNKRYLHFWKQIMFACILFTMIYLVIYYELTGDPFYRWQSIQAFNEQTSSYGYIRSYLNSHYTGYFPAWINAQLGYLFILIFAIFSFFTIQVKKLSNFQFYLSVFAIILLVEYVILFHTEKYGFLFRQERVWMLLIPALSILSAYFFFQATRNLFLVVGSLFLLIGIFNYPLFGSNRLLLFLLFAIPLGMMCDLKEKPKMRFAVSLFPFLILAANFIYGNSNYRVGSLQSGNIIKEELEQMSASGKKIILCDEIFAGTHKVYNNGKEYDNLIFYSFSKYDSLKNEKVFVLIDQERDKVPEYIKSDSLRWKLIVDKKKLLIYKN